jgi:uncharacterized protein (TIGR02145 family)
MKTILTLFLSLFLIVNASFAQDTLYVYKAGTVAYKSEISSVDSVTFKKVYYPVNDIDGNGYQMVKIGTQTWMASNLRVTHYRNGDVISNVTDNTAWSGLTTGAWCDYSNLVANGNKYGHLYNWYAVTDVRNIAPIGWHVPTDAEWTTLSTYLGGESVAGGKLKEVGTLNWIAPNTGATNETWFSGLPGGSRQGDLGSFQSVGIVGSWLNSTESYGGVFSRQLLYNSSSMTRGLNSKNGGYSVRCIKD